MIKKILNFDIESTGLDPVKNDIIQLAAIVEIDGNVVDEININMQPFSYENIEPEALKISHTTVDDLRGYMPAIEAYDKFIELLSKHIDKFNKADKFLPCAYNGSFDLNFVNQWFVKNGDKYFGSWQNWQLLDPLPIFRMMGYLEMLDVPNYKLETIANYYGIEIDAHDALSDIRATRELRIIAENTIKHTPAKELIL